jgi:hypothetical protein
LATGWQRTVRPDGALCHNVVCGSKKRGVETRIVVLTDIGPNDVEPDDMESMVRLLVHAISLRLKP